MDDEYTFVAAPVQHSTIKATEYMKKAVND